jgi:mono/diheme cytochrome c family protein
MSADNLPRTAKPGLPYGMGCFGFAASLGAAIAFSMGLMIGCHSAPQLTSQEIVGKHLYVVRCAHCHEENDLALKKIPPNLHSVFKGATLPSGVPATDSEVRRVILEGRGLMPGFNGRFTDEQMAALLAYLHTGLR